MSRSPIFRTGLILAAAPALAVGAIPTAQAAAYDHPVASTYEVESAAHKRDRHDRYDRYDRYESRDRYGERYGSRDYYRGDRVTRNTRVWRGNDGRYYCRKDNGTTGLLIGGVAGALVGRSIDTRGDRATGTILGAAAGALLGREVDRNNSRPRCR